ncbi:MAG: porin [Nitrospirota bacterium]|nr:porin [Nitrospirota bacterium]
MRKHIFVSLAVLGVVFFGFADVYADEIADLKEMLKKQSEIIQQLQKRLEQVEQRQAPATPRPTAAEHKGAEEKGGATLSDRLAAVEERVKAMPELPGGIKISGLLDTSYTYNFNRPDNYYVGGTRYTDKNRKNSYRVFDTEADSFNVDLFELVVEKPLAEKGDAGFRVDLNVGETPNVLDGGSDDFEFQQAYVTWRAPIGNGLDISLGKFVTLLGAEVIEAPLNYNISRSYLFGYAIPFTHTGVRFQYPVNDLLSVTMGINNGWDNETDNNHAKSIEGQLAFNFSERYQLFVNGIYGAEQDDNSGRKRGVIDLVAVLKPVDKLTLVLNYDYGDEQDAYTDSGTAALRRANWQGFSAIANYDFTEKFSLAARAEYFSDDDGYRLNSSRPSGVASFEGRSIEMEEYTLTAQYRLTPSMAVRAEIRLDKSDEDIFVDEKKLEDNQVTGALEFYYRF